MWAFGPDRSANPIAYLQIVNIIMNIQIDIIIINIQIDIIIIKSTFKSSASSSTFKSSAPSSNSVECNWSNTAWIFKQNRLVPSWICELSRRAFFSENYNFWRQVWWFWNWYPTHDNVNADYLIFIWLSFECQCVFRNPHIFVLLQKRGGQRLTRYMQASGRPRQKQTWEGSRQLLHIQNIGL